MSALTQNYIDRQQARIADLEAALVAQKQRAEALEFALNDQAARTLHFYRLYRQATKGTRER